MILPPCITQSIQEHESAPPILKYEEALERQATSGNFDLNLQQVLTLGLTDGKQDGGKKSRSKSKNKKDQLAVTQKNLEEIDMTEESKDPNLKKTNEITTVEKKYTKHATTA